MCLTKSDLLGGLYMIPCRIDLDLGKKNVSKNTLGVTGKCNKQHQHHQLSFLQNSRSILEYIENENDLKNYYNSTLQ